jgi:hypothetical protein
MISCARAAGRLVAAVLVVGSGACGGGGAPGGPSSPSPTPAPLPTPTPVPSDPPLSAACDRLRLGMASGQERCRPEGPTYLDQLDEAIERLVSQKPQIFDQADVRGAGEYLVLSEGQFFVGVIQNLDQMGLCAGLYAEELAITDRPDFSDNYDIHLSTGHIRRGDSSYRSTCYPASFTTPMPPAGHVAGCTLPNSLSLSCKRESPVFLQAISDALVEITRTQPGIFDLNDARGQSDGYRVLDPGAYTSGLVTILLGKGFCARWDGEEINVKRDNVSSENYDVLRADGYMRRGEGSYRVSCYPAYF